jgi:hypothetical protein
LSPDESGLDWNERLGSHRENGGRRGGVSGLDSHDGLPSTDPLVPEPRAVGEPSLDPPVAGKPCPRNRGGADGAEAAWRDAARVTRHGATHPPVTTHDREATDDRLAIRSGDRLPNGVLETDRFSPELTRINLTEAALGYVHSWTAGAESIPDSSAASDVPVRPRQLPLPSGQ